MTERRETFSIKRSFTYGDIKKYFKSLTYEERRRELNKLLIDLYFMEYDEIVSSSIASKNYSEIKD